MKKIVGLVVARAGVIRDGYQALLSAIPGVGAAEPANDGPSALARLDSDSPDLFILDSSLCVNEIIETLVHIKHRRVAIRCLVICPPGTTTRKMRRFGADTAVDEGITPAHLAAALKVLVIPTNEELAIAQETLAAIRTLPER